MEEKKQQPHPVQPSTLTPEPAMDADVDRLLREVEALTEEVLAETQPRKSRGGTSSADSTPAQDPSRRVAADDVGLVADTPLVRQDDNVPVEEIVADVDRELDSMEKLISGATASKKSMPKAQEAFPDIPESPDRSARCEMDSDIVAASTAEPPRPGQAFSRQEQKLDQDLDALLAAHLPKGEQEAPVKSQGDRKAPPSLPPVLDRARTERPARPTAAGPATAATLRDVSIRRLLKERIRSKTRGFLQKPARWLGDALVWVLSRVDAWVGGRLSPRAKELAGYCALGTLAMCVVAVVVALL